MKTRGLAVTTVIVLTLIALGGDGFAAGFADPKGDLRQRFDLAICRSVQDMIRDGRRIFRFDTFGDEAFWGGQDLGIVTLQIPAEIQSALPLPLFP